MIPTQYQFGCVEHLVFRAPNVLFGTISSGVPTEEPRAVEVGDHDVAVFLDENILRF